MDAPSKFRNYQNRCQRKHLQIFLKIIAVCNYKMFKKYFRRFNLIYTKNNSNTDFPFGIFRSFNNNLFNYRFTTFVSSKLFLYPLKASENLMATYWNKWVKTSNSRIMKMQARSALCNFTLHSMKKLVWTIIGYHTWRNNHLEQFWKTYLRVFWYMQKLSSVE